MNTPSIKYYIGIIALTISLIGCNGKGHQHGNEEGHTHEEQGHSEHSHEHGEETSVHLSDLKVQSIGLQMAPLQKRALSGIVTANGQLEVPPQYEAMVTSILGGNIQSIQISEGDKVRKGQVLASIAHPELARLQTDYIKAYNEMNFLKKDFEREQKLYEAKVTSGKQFQRTDADYKAAQALVNGYESQLRQLNISPAKIRQGKIAERISIVSPINGYVEKVFVKLGQYVEAQTPIFSILDNSKLHADLMVYEKDINQVKKGQKVRIRLTSMPDEEFTAVIETVGKQFEETPKAVHIHAEIDEKKPFMLPKMYLTGQILTDATEVWALPEEAIIEDGGKNYLFVATSEEKEGEKEWEFEKVAIEIGNTSDGWTEVKLLEPLPENAQIVQNKAYYLIAEMKKGETAHEH